MRNYSAITLLRNIFFASYMKPSIIKHELVHIEQQALEGSIKFYLKYLWCFIKNLFKGMSWNDAYMNIPYEQEAYKSNERVMDYKII